MEEWLSAVYCVQVDVCCLVHCTFLCVIAVGESCDVSQFSIQPDNLLSTHADLFRLRPNLDGAGRQLHKTLASKVTSLTDSLEAFVESSR
jgi:hypothetical protein